mmetsp:Transcript_10625/g.18486  ORF Transcript_10625/g.18486 Transcript_10625/m.18486 type:complete len:144 (-) Transcript_10625:123-554(-)
MAGGEEEHPGTSKPTAKHECGQSWNSRVPAGTPGVKRKGQPNADALPSSSAIVNLQEMSEFPIKEVVTRTPLEQSGPPVQTEMERNASGVSQHPSLQLCSTELGGGDGGVELVALSETFAMSSRKCLFPMLDDPNNTCSPPTA